MLTLNKLKSFFCTIDSVSLIECQVIVEQSIKKRVEPGFTIELKDFQFLQSLSCFWIRHLSLFKLAVLPSPHWFIQLTK